MIRVLHFTRAINANDFLDSVAGRMDIRRFEVSALIGQPPPAKVRLAPSYRTRYLNLTFSRRTCPAMLSALGAELRRVRPHILHAHHYEESIVAALAVRLSCTPGYVIGRHYSDHLYVLSQGIRRQLLLAAEAFANHTAAGIMVPTKEVEDVLVKRQGVPARKVVVIPYALDLRAYRASAPDAGERLRASVGVGARCLVLSCSRLSREKGLEHLLRAVAALAERRERFLLVIAGDGPCRSDLERLAAELGIEDTVRFVGWRDDALDWMAAADVVVQPSQSESYCQVLVEALAFAKPVVATPVGVAPEIIGDNERGRIVPFGDPGALASVIAGLMDDPAEGHALGVAGRAYLERTLDAAGVARQHEDLYERIVNA